MYLHLNTKSKAIYFKAIMMMCNGRITGTFQKLKSKYLFVKWIHLFYFKLFESCCSHFINCIEQGELQIWLRVGDFSVHEAYRVTVIWLKFLSAYHNFKNQEKESSLKNKTLIDRKKKTIIKQKETIRTRCQI